MVLTECPSCKCKHRIDESIIGTTISCQKCDKKFKITQTQTKKRIPDLIELAVTYKLITREQLVKAISIQKDKKLQESNEVLMEILLENKMIDESKLGMIREIHKYLETRSLDQQFGKIAVKGHIIALMLV